jgi:hypothetical protein
MINMQYVMNMRNYPRSWIAVIQDTQDVDFDSDYESEEYYEYEGEEED